ncbi:MAG: flagellar export protein FliJ [Candidatus Coatesbacteria bacterium]|nr:MAG: flagellar export protein FliJ [Candidatus Coatesbacteria bacterium]
MKAFRFRLERVLQLRQQIEQEKRRELSVMLFDLRQLEAKLHALQNDLNSCKKEMSRDLEQEDLSIARIEVFAAYIKRTMSAIDAQRELISELLKRIEAKKNELIESIRERKAMESVRSKRLEQYHKEFARAEMKFLDEVASFPRPLSI